MLPSKESEKNYTKVPIQPKYENWIIAFFKIKQQWQENSTWEIYSGILTSLALLLFSLQLSVIPQKLLPISSSLSSSCPELFNTEKPYLEGQRSLYNNHLEGQRGKPNFTYRLKNY